MAEGLTFAVIGTDTGIGKTAIVGALVTGLRRLGRRCWVHKPVACGGWDGATADDGRALAPLVGDGQDPATVCPRQFAEPASPHLAAAAAGAALTLPDLAAGIARLRGPHDLVVEGAGGLLVPLTPRRETIADLLVAARLPALIVTRPDLGTLNHTALTVAHCRARGIPLLGLVVNRARPVADALATRTAARELAELVDLAVLADVPHGGVDDAARRLAEAVVAAVIR